MHQKKQAIKKNIIKEIEVQIEQTEQELIGSNFKHSIQLERDILVNNMQNFVEEEKNGAKKKGTEQGGSKKAKEAQNTFIVWKKRIIQKTQ